MNRVERFAGTVGERHCPAEDQPPVWVERQLWPERSPQETRFRRVVFAGADRYRPQGPRWSVLTRETRLRYQQSTAVPHSNKLCCPRHAHPSRLPFNPC
ncbi:hypothetical protein [Streptomyces sp. NPDC057460]|uniref:hypothetical protein n=1 Tax=Streptomyces sp. NPDC057460 TaxID=3346141 RepID=UPI0036BE091F